MYEIVRDRHVYSDDLRLGVGISMSYVASELNSIPNKNLRSDQDMCCNIRYP